MDLGPLLKRSNECPVCSGAMRGLIYLPQFPLTEKYEPWSGDFNPSGFVDQVFDFCEKCSHGKLEVVIPPSELYGDGYRTTTAKSVGASRSIRTFYDFITRHVPTGNYRVVIDIGGNDGALLENFTDYHRVAVDPNASGDAELIRSYIEDADLSGFKAERKLILSSHTLEHLERPERMLEKVSSILGHGDFCAFQFPSLDMMVADARIDQVHHQHIHYFSLKSFSKLAGKFGFEIVAHEFDHDHYGTLMVVFRRGNATEIGSSISTHAILIADGDFRQGMNSFEIAIERLENPIGYGAALMLPVLDYYADLEPLSCVVDEDESKHGLRYINLDKQIKPVPDVAGKDFVVTAFNTKMAVRKIAAKLSDKGARNVVVPFNCL